jgi:hypothetical protein
LAASGDFNVDGWPDLAVANRDANSVSILSGRGDGSFAAKVDYTAPLAPRSVAVGDFNLDGWPDLVVAAPQTNGVSVLLGKGKGTFADPVFYPSGEGALSVAMGDFDGDGRPDIAVANAPSTPTRPATLPITVTVLLGNGDGSFRSGQEYTAGSMTYPGATSLVAADFNADRVLDIAVAEYDSGAVGVMLGNGDGTFGAVVDHDVGRRPFGLVAGDFDLDGVADLAAKEAISDMSGVVSVLLGKGDGTFADKVDYLVRGELGPVAVGDFNLDGKPDLAAANSPDLSSSMVTLLRGNGDGTFGTTVEYEVERVNRSVLTSLVVSDFDLDARPDIVATEPYSNTVRVLLGRCL